MNTSDSTLQPLLDDLSVSLRGCDPLNTSETAQVMRHLSSLAVRLERESKSELLPLCRMALALMEHVSRHGIIGPDEAIELVAQAVREIQRSTHRPEGNRFDVEKLSANVKDHSETGLQLIDGRKLGEILVTLSMLKPEQVEKVLRQQHQTGKRFGEALIEMGLLPKEAVEAALRIQRLRKSKRKDPWAEPTK